ncbi:MAG: DUF5106 domain-containing protein [Muribaculaceae bacterium]
MKKLGLLSLFISLLLCNVSALAQEEKPKTLFPYPIVPDTIVTLENRSNFLVSHFWEKCDLSKPIKDKEAFEKAFYDYAVFFQYAHRNVVYTSINNLMNKAQSSAQNFIYIAEIAEKTFYEPNAVIWSDEAYLPFAENVVNFKKIKKDEKERYLLQIQKIKNNKIGEVAHKFEYIDVNGAKKNFNDISAETILLFFNDDDCSDCMIARLRLSTNVTINNLIKENKLKIISIYPGQYSAEWANKAKGYADNWEIGAYEDADNIYDIRVMPNLYILDKDKKIILKNVNVNDVINNIGR